MRGRRKELALSKAYHNPVNDGSHRIPVDGVAAREIRHYHAAPPPTSVADILKTAHRFEAAGITGIELVQRVAASHGVGYIWTIAFLRSHYFSMPYKSKRRMNRAPTWIVMTRKKNPKANAKSVLFDNNMAKSKAHLDKLIAGACSRVQR